MEEDKFLVLQDAGVKKTRSNRGYADHLIGQVAIIEGPRGPAQ